MMGLTGPPRIAGLLMPYASQNRAMDWQWNNVSTYHVFRSQLRKRVRGRFRGRITFGYEALDVETAYQIQTFASSTGTVLFTPRTRLDTDPVWAVEQEHEVMLTSPLTGLTNPATGLVALAMGAGDHRRLSVDPDARRRIPADTASRVTRPRS